MKKNIHQRFKKLPKLTFYVYFRSWNFFQFLKNFFNFCKTFLTNFYPFHDSLLSWKYSWEDILTIIEAFIFLWFCQKLLVWHKCFPRFPWFLNNWLSHLFVLEKLYSLYASINDCLLLTRNRFQNTIVTLNSKSEVLNCNDELFIRKLKR